MKLAGVGDTKWWSPRDRKHAVGRVEDYTGSCLSLGLSLQTEVSRASISQTPFLRVQIRRRNSTGPSGRGEEDVGRGNHPSRCLTVPCGAGCVTDNTLLSAPWLPFLLRWGETYRLSKMWKVKIPLSVFPSVNLSVAGWVPASSSMLWILPDITAQAGCVRLSVRKGWGGGS